MVASGYLSPLSFSSDGEPGGAIRAACRIFSQAQKRRHPLLDAPSLIGEGREQYFLLARDPVVNLRKIAPRPAHHIVSS